MEKLKLINGNKQEMFKTLEKIKKEIVDCPEFRMKSGICVFIFMLKLDKKITDKQYGWVLSILPGQRYNQTTYCWKPKAKSPRIKWLDEQINMLKKGKKNEI